MEVPARTIAGSSRYSAAMRAESRSDVLPAVTYGDWRTGLEQYKARLIHLIDTEQPREICDVGGGAQPTLTVNEIATRNLKCTLLDISSTELDKAPDEYKKLRLDICADLPADTPTYDFVFSHMLAEHVEHPASFHRNIFTLLKPGGLAAHMMPTYFDPAFVANALLPASFSASILRKLQPDRDLGHLEGKFPAYYRWCRGPSPRHIRRLESTGFHVEQMAGYFGTGYLASIAPLQRVYERVWTRPLIHHPIAALTSYCWVVLRRPVARPDLGATSAPSK
jgi:SAM-dependent methyltransferase